MTQLLSEPGFWEIDEADYHADPAPEPSLSQSIGKILLDSCPRKAWQSHPRLNPNFAPDESARFDAGTVAHRLLLGKGREFKIIDAADYRSNSTKLERDTARAAGLTPILVAQYERALAMATAARQQLPDFDGGKFAFSTEWGDIELSGLSRDPVGCWTRSLIDFYGARVPTGVTCWDYKTGSGSANPAALRYRFSDMGWAFQAAFQERIIVTLKPGLAGKVAFRFLVQEDEEPYLCSVVEPDGSARTIAHKRVAAAIAIWTHCLKVGQWPAYPHHSVPIGITPGAEAAWLSRELDDELVRLAANDPFLNSQAWPAVQYAPIFGLGGPYSPTSPNAPHGVRKDGQPALKRGPKPKRPFNAAIEDPGGWKDAGEVPRTLGPPPQPPDLIEEMLTTDLARQASEEQQQ